MRKGACTRVSPLSGYEPTYDPKAWNVNRDIRETHNCFSYAMNVNDPKQIAKCRGKKLCEAPFHQPGSAAGHEGFTAKKPKTCSNMMARILGDNPHVQMTKFENRCPKGSSKIALVVDESDDYHFLRQDSDSYWSQKSGARPVTNLDASKHRIWDPAMCDLNFSNHEGVLNYDNFCSYMCVPRTRPLYLRTGGGRRATRSRATRKRRTA